MLTPTPPRAAAAAADGMLPGDIPLKRSIDGVALVDAAPGAAGTGVGGGGASAASTGAHKLGRCVAAQFFCLPGGCDARTGTSCIKGCLPGYVGFHGYCYPR